MIKYQLALESNYFLYHPGQIGNTQVFPGADIYQFFSIIILHQKSTSPGEIISVQKLSFRSTRAPNYNFLSAGGFRFMHLSDKRRQNMRIIEIITISFTV